MSDAYRQSALLLHGVGEADRNWILAQLAAEEREPLTQHLIELKGLGMPVDGSLAARFLTQPLTQKDVREVKSAECKTFPDASVEAIHLLFEGEPMWLIAAVLSIRTWPWHDAFINKLDTSRREQIRIEMRESVPIKLGLALVSRLEARLPNAVDEAERLPIVSPPLTSFSQQIHRFARKWF